MSEAFLERRRTPRIPMGNGHEIGMPMALTVRLVDISASGVLLSSPQRMAIGQRAHLRTTLGGEALNAEVEVRRVADAGFENSGRGRYRLGAVFVSLDEVGRRSVQHFLRDEGE